MAEYHTGCDLLASFVAFQIGISRVFIKGFVHIFIERLVQVDDFILSQQHHQVGKNGFAKRGSGKDGLHIIASAIGSIHISKGFLVNEL